MRAEPTAIEPITALLKEITIRYSVAYSTDEFREVLDAFGNGDIDPSHTIGPSFPLERIADAFDAVRTTHVGESWCRPEVYRLFLRCVVGGHTGDH